MNVGRLPTSELERIFNAEIYPELIFGKSCDNKKEAAIVGGQPGSGKSSVVQILLKQKENFVFINGDDLREFLPGYKVLMESDPDNAADSSQYAVNFWVEKAIDKCVEDGLSIIVEGTMRVSETPLTTAIKLKDAGYEITFVLVSTPYELSLESIRIRYEEAVKIYGLGRSTKIESHDQAFLGIKKTILVLFNSKIASRFIVINRTKNSELEFNEFNPNDEAKILEQFNKNRGDIPIQNNGIFDEANKEPKKT
ncbi:MAG: UDP-N-acetylglucosamine kinase [Patescibacteria group bacterium]|nr:UDP-N-acetylglucosamine kinase [Patescibacteria group bacterium]